MVIDRRAALADTVGTTWVNAAELYYGAAKSSQPERNRLLVTEFLATLAIVDFDLAAAQVFGEVKALLEREGRRLADADLLIGSVAASRGALLVTGNRRHYERIQGIALENWPKE